jgi:hypothetical protein
MAGVGRQGAAVIREPATLLDFAMPLPQLLAQCHNPNCKLKQTDQSLANYS